MRPRLRSRGVRTRCLRSTRLTHGFNEAAASQPRSPDIEMTRPRHTDRFNEAAASQPRSPSPAVR